MSSQFFKNEKIYFSPHLGGGRDIFSLSKNTKYKTFLSKICNIDEGKFNLYIKNILKSKTDIFLTVFSQDDDNLIGFTMINNIDYISRSAEIYIASFDEINFNSILNLISFFSFDRLNLNRITINFTDKQKNLIEYALSFGYFKEGILRNFIFREGKYYNLIKMSILRK